MMLIKVMQHYLLEKSHKYHKNFKEDNNITEKSNWYKLNENEINYYMSKGCKKRLIKCPAGSIVLWDSRTIHCGRECRKERSKPNFRGVSYICMKPEVYQLVQKLKKGKKLFILKEQQVTGQIK